MCVLCPVSMALPHPTACQCQLSSRFKVLRKASVIGDWLRYIQTLYKGEVTYPVSSLQRIGEGGPQGKLMLCYRNEGEVDLCRTKGQMVSTHCEPGQPGNLFLAHACLRWGQHPQWNQLSGSQSRDPASKPALAAKALLPAWIGFISVPVTCSY